VVVVALHYRLTSDLLFEKSDNPPIFDSEYPAQFSEDMEVIL